MPYYILVAALAFLVVLVLWRFHNSPVGSVLVAIRENEQRARFLGYATDRYKLVAFTMSAAITGLAGALLLFNNRMTSAEPISVAFSGELLAMVVIGGMRSSSGPALGALFYVIFRDYLSSLTANWLFVFGLLFVAFIVFSPRALSASMSGDRAVPEQAVEDAAMAARSVGAVPLPDFLAPGAYEGRHSCMRNIVKSFGGIKAVEGTSFGVRDRALARVDRPERSWKNHGLQPDLGHVCETGQQVLVKSDSDIESIEDLKGEEVCSASGSTSLENINAAGAVGVPADTYSICAEQVADGSVPAMSTDGSILLGLAAQYDGELKVVGPEFSEERIGIGYSKDSPEMCEWINEVIQEAYDDGTWAEAFEATLGERGAETPEPPELDPCQ